MDGVGRGAALVAAAAAAGGLVAALLARRAAKKAEEEAQTLRREMHATIEAKVLDTIRLTMPTEAAGGAGGDSRYPPVTRLPEEEQLRILVTGGAGFVGSNLVDALMMQGHIVYVVDNLFTGRRKNIAHWIGHPNFQFFHHDVVLPFFTECDQIYHMACPASPPHYQYNPVKTIKTSTHGTLNMLGLAKRCKARLLFTSTSEIYGDPEVHPQPETYWGNVNTLGPRSCYDEGKRVAETMCHAYAETCGVEVRICRIFNTFGPRMNPDDGRVVSNFIKQALQGKPLTIFGDGEQTRSFQYVSDLVRGMILLMNSDYTKPVNLGNPQEQTIRQFAQHIQETINPDVQLRFLPALRDDPKQRQPEIAVATRELGWTPRVTTAEGLTTTIDYFRHEMRLARDGKPVKPIWIEPIPDPLSGKRTGGAATRMAV